MIRIEHVGEIAADSRCVTVGHGDRVSPPYLPWDRRGERPYCPGILVAEVLGGRVTVGVDEPSGWLDFITVRAGETVVVPHCQGAWVLRCVRVGTADAVVELRESDV